MEATIIPISSISPSDSNPRQAFDPEALAELAEDIRRRGLLQPLLVRDLGGAGGGYELIAGERRFRAAKKAGLEEVPVLVREFSDQEVLEGQLMENLLREDLHPLEVAQALSELHTKHGLSTEDLAKRMGKSIRTIQADMQLAKLQGKARELCQEGKLEKSTALLVARIPDAKLQAKAASEITTPKYGDTTMSYRQAAELIQRDYMLELTKAPFDTEDAELVAGAGPCSACPKRTGAQPELFADLKNHDICTDVPCYRKKEDAWWAAKVAASKAGGQAVLSAAESKQVFTEYGGGVHHSAGYVLADAQCSEDEKWRSYRTLLGKSAKAHTVLARSPKGEIVELLPKEGLKKLLDEADKIKRREPVRATPQEKAAAEREKAKRRVSEAVTRTAIGKAVAKLESEVPRKVWLMLAKQLADSYESERVLERRVKNSDDEKELEAFEASLDKITEAQLRAFVIEAAFGDALYSYAGGYTDELKQLCEILKIDLKELEADAKAAEKVAAKGDAPMPKKSKAVKKGTCRECGCTEDNACPDGCAWADKTETLCTSCVGGKEAA